MGRGNLDPSVLAKTGEAKGYRNQIAEVNDAV